MGGQNDGRLAGLQIIDTASLPAELRRWCTNTGTTKCDTKMVVYLFVRVASTANLWCNKQKLIKK